MSMTQPPATQPADEGPISITLVHGPKSRQAGEPVFQLTAFATERRTVGYTLVTPGSRTPHALQNLQSKSFFPALAKGRWHDQVVEFARQSLYTIGEITS